MSTTRPTSTRATRPRFCEEERGRRGRREKGERERKERKGKERSATQAKRNLFSLSQATSRSKSPSCFPFPKNSTISFSEFNGAHGIIAGCLVALTQVMPDEDVSWGGNGGGGVRVKHLLASYVAAATVVSLFTKSLLSTLPVVLAGAYSSWLYLRFVQVKEGLGLR